MSSAILVALLTRHLSRCLQAASRVGRCESPWLIEVAQSNNFRTSIVPRQLWKTSRGSRRDVRDTQKKVLVALGGNALKKPKEKGTEAEMFHNVKVAADQLSEIVMNGYSLTVTHGNGPQVGAIVLQQEMAEPKVPAMDLCVCGAESQGMLGYFLQQSLGNAFASQKTPKQIVSLVTQVVVDEADPAFKNPTKPVGSFMSKEKADALMKEGKQIKEDSGRGWRVVVPSPRPIEVVEWEAIKTLVDSGIIVVAGGGGGVPVARDINGHLVGVPAVIDKDMGGALLATLLNSDAFLILTDVDAVYLNWLKPNKEAIAHMTISEAKQHMNANHFAEGSMKPKIQAAIEYVEKTGNKAVISSLELAVKALEGKCGTTIVPDPQPKFGGLFEGIQWPTGLPASPLDHDVNELAHKYTPLACEILKEAIRIPKDYMGKKHGTGIVGMSNNEGPRLEYLKKMCIEHKCVENASDVWFDDFGSIVWTVEDKNDGIERSLKKVIYFDGHTDTVNPLPEVWRQKIGGIDVYDGLVDPSNVDVDFLRSELGYLPPKEEWKHLIFGRGGADQLSGVISQMIGTKIMLELKDKGALRGVIIRSYGTVAEEDNDGGAPMFVVRKQLPGAPPEMIPDVVIHTEGTGDKDKGATGIYIGQRGRMQIEVEIIGRSCHGSMPWEGLNPLEYASLIIAEARDQYLNGESFLEDPFLSGGTRTASWCDIQTPSDCAVPASFTFRFDRRLTVGETPEAAVRAVENLKAVARTRAAGLKVNISIPTYTTPTWRGYTPGNEQVYPGWMTPPTHEAVQTAYDTYKRVVTSYMPANHVDTPTNITKEPRIDRWVFSTDGVGYPIPHDGWGKTIHVPEHKEWVDAGPVKHPAMIGMGIGFEQNTHKIGEFVDERHFWAALAFVSRFPSLYAERSGVLGQK